MQNSFSLSSWKTCASSAVPTYHLNNYLSFILYCSCVNSQSIPFSKSIFTEDFFKEEAMSKSIGPYVICWNSTSRPFLEPSQMCPSKLKTQMWTTWTYNKMKDFAGCGLNKSSHSLILKGLAKYLLMRQQKLNHYCFEVRYSIWSKWINKLNKASPFFRSQKKVQSFSKIVRIFLKK